MIDGKITLKTLLKWMILICCALNYQLFYFMLLPNNLLRYNSANNKTLIAIIVVGMFLTMLGNNRLRCMSKWMRKYLIFFFGYCLFVYCFSIVKYSSSMYSVFSVSYFYLILLMVAPLVYVFSREGNFERFIDTVMYMTLVAMILLAVQSYVYNATGYIFLKGYFQASARMNMRRGLLRMSITPLGPFVSIYAGYRALTSEKKRMQYALIALFGIYGTVFVSRTRMLIIITVVCNLIMYLLSVKNIKSANKWIVVFAIAIVGIVMLPQLNVFFDTFSVNNAETGSNTSIRFEAIAYYMGYILRAPLTGQGFINAANSDTLYMLLRGRGGYFYYDDIGMIGTASRFGIPGFLFQLILIPYFWKIIRATQNRKEHLLLCGLMTYYILSLISLSMFDTQRIFVLAIVLAIFDYVKTMHERERMVKNND